MSPTSNFKKICPQNQALILITYRQKDRHDFLIRNSVTFIRKLNDWLQRRFCYENFLGLHNSVCGMNLVHGAEIVK
jgi:hypothetical protein